MIPRNSPHWDAYVQAMLARNPDQQRALLQRAQALAGEQLRTQDASITTTYNTSMALMKDAGFSLPGDAGITASNPLIPGGGGGSLGDPALAFKNTPKPDPDPDADAGPLIPQHKRDASWIASGAGSVEDYFRENDVSAADLVPWAISAGVIASFKDLKKFNKKELDNLIKGFEAEVADRTSMSKSKKPLNKTNTARKLESHWKNGKFDDYMKGLGEKHGVTFTDDELKEFRNRGKAGRKLIPQEFIDDLDRKRGGWIKQLSNGTRNALFPMDPTTGKRVYNPFQKGVPDSTKGRIGRGTLYATLLLGGKDIFDLIVADSPEDAKKQEEAIEKIARTDQVKAELLETIAVEEVDKNSSYALNAITSLENDISEGNSTENNATALTPGDSISEDNTSSEGNRTALSTGFVNSFGDPVEAPDVEPPPVPPPVDTNQLMGPSSYAQRYLNDASVYDQNADEYIRLLIKDRTMKETLETTPDDEMLRNLTGHYRIRPEVAQRIIDEKNRRQAPKSLPPMQYDDR